MTPKPRNPNPSGLGRAIINRKVQDARKVQESGLFSTDVDTMNRLKSITQERDLDEFLNTAQLAGTEFTAERRNVKIIQQTTSSAQNPYLLSEQEEKKTIKKHIENKMRLRVPRRPPWKKSMTSAELDKQERVAFLDWRRGLAQLQEEDKFLLTPFERNLEVWRQLWRVIERSHLIVQIVDARNPLRFRCEDLEAYIRDVEGPEGESGGIKGLRNSLLLINKADLLTIKQRSLWADYFDAQGISYAFFSAANAVALQIARREATEGKLQVGVPEKSFDNDESSEDDEGPVSLSNVLDEAHERYQQSDDETYFSAEEETTGDLDRRITVLSVLQLEELFLQLAPDISTFGDSLGQPPTKLIVGLVGYPNVGKSSTINSLLGEKKVSVSSTPGKTKHFQTIHLSDTIILCDCPGLVFPQFATTKAELVCDGVLPIDQMKEYSGPISLIIQRIPTDVLQAVYGLTVKVRSIEEGGDGKVTAENFLIAYAIARGYTRSGQGNPDEARSARYILKDYVNGKLLFCHPPPGISGSSFNEPTHHIVRLKAEGKKRAPVTRVGKSADTFVPPNMTDPLREGSIQPIFGQGPKSKAVDRAFFENDSSLAARPFIQGSLHSGKMFSRMTKFPHQNAVANDGSLLVQKQTELQDVSDGKRHHKKLRRLKQRSGKGYD